MNIDEYPEVFDGYMPPVVSQPNGQEHFFVVYDSENRTCGAIVFGAHTTHRRNGRHLWTTPAIFTTVLVHFTPKFNPYVHSFAQLQDIRMFIELSAQLIRKS